MPHAPTVARLARALLDPDRDPALADELARWLAGSPRFGAFVEAHEAKIRKKLRGGADVEALRDVRAELLDRPPAARRPADRACLRGVRLRPRRPGLHDHIPRDEDAQPRGHPPAARAGRRRARAAALLREAPPAPAGNAQRARGGDRRRLASQCRRRGRGAGRAGASGREGRGVLRRPRVRRAAGLLRSLPAPGRVITWCEGAEAEARATPWVNRSARIAVPDRALEACLACLRASAD